MPMGRHRPVGAVALLAALVALGGCTADAGPRLPSADAVASRSTPAVEPADDVVERERQFVACMRGRGVEMIDPVPGDRSGRSALLHEIDVNGQGDDPAFQAALDACASFLPPVEAPVPDEAAHARLREFAACMRDNGLDDFPDPEPGTGRIVYAPADPGEVAQVTNYEGQVFIVDAPGVDDAMARCRALIPPRPPAATPTPA
jgi:hypothetical protein